jgi:hypothetical protein
MVDELQAPDPQHKTTGCALSKLVIIGCSIQSTVEISMYLQTYHSMIARPSNAIHNWPFLKGGIALSHITTPKMIPLSFARSNRIEIAQVGNSPYPPREDYRGATSDVAHTLVDDDFHSDLFHCLS